MNRIIACCVFLCLLFSTQSVADEKCGLKLLASLDAARSADDRFYIPVNIAGKTFLMTIDTGGLTNLFRESIAKELGFSIHAFNTGKDGLRMRDGAGNYLTRSTRVPEMRLGQILIEDEPFLVMPDHDFNQAEKNEAIRVAGSLGQAFLEQYDVELDPLHRKVRFFSQDHCSGNVVYWSQTYFEIPFHQTIKTTDRYLRKLSAYYPWINTDKKTPSPPFRSVRLDGVSMHASIDTGASTTFLDTNKARRSFDIDPEKDQLVETEQTRFASAQKSKTNLHQFNRLDIGDVTFLNPHINLVDLDNSPKAPRLIIGMDRLKQMRLYIAYKEGVIYGTPANAGRDMAAGLKPAPNSP